MKRQLVDLFELDKIYKEQDLKITRVCEMLNTNRTYISRIINSDFSCSFSYYVNHYRIEEARKILKAETDTELVLESVAAQVGFSSVASFIRNFKQICGVTPGAYRKMNH